MDEKVTREVAELEFDRICKAARVKWERYAEMSEAGAKADKIKVVDAIMDGRIAVNDEGFPTVYTECDKLPEVRFTHRPLGGDMVAMDRYKPDQIIARNNAVISKYLGINRELLERLEHVDLSLVQTIHGIFLGL